jgi:hypothetical protein
MLKYIEEEDQYILIYHDRSRSDGGYIHWPGPEALRRLAAAHHMNLEKYLKEVAANVAGSERGVQTTEVGGPAQ